MVKEASQACFEGEGESYISGKVGWTYFIFFWKLEQEWKDQTYCEAGSWYIRLERMEKEKQWRQLMLILSPTMWVIAAMKLKDAYSLEGKLGPT